MTGGENGGGIGVISREGKQVVGLGASADGNGSLEIFSNTGETLIYAGALKSGSGFIFRGYNKTGEGVVQLSADDYGNGVVGAYNRKGKGRTLKPGP